MRGRHAARTSGLLRFGAVLVLLVGVAGAGLAVVVALTSGGDESRTSRPALKAGGTTPSGATSAASSPASASGAPAGSPSPTGTASMMPMAPTVALRLVGTSWIEVRGPDGGVLVSRVFREGERMAFSQRQVQVTIGRSGAVHMQANGMPFDLTGPSRVRVVTVMRGGD
jgi:hypothetical protein